MTCAFEIVDPGFQTLLQDLGRAGCNQLGITSGGPMDLESFELANRLCNNHISKASLEICIGGICLVSKSETVIAFTGANMPLKINGTPAEQWRSHRIVAGTCIEISHAVDGVYGYLAVAGGFEAEPVYGSVSCVMREHLGGHKQDGSALQSGDQLFCSPQHSASRLLYLPEAFRPKRPKREVPLRVILGCQHDDFDSIQKRIFFTSKYHVSQHTNRMGYRLTGPKIASKISDLLSEGTSLGAIQVPRDGQPIILMRDRQTMGGYPKLGSLFSLDVDKLSQLAQGSIITFEPISVEEAHNALLLEVLKRRNRKLSYIDLIKRKQVS